MGTNFYLRNKVKKEKAEKLIKIIEDYLDLNSQEDLDLLEDVKLLIQNKEMYDIHICKFSHGWQPLFQETLLFKSVEQLKSFYFDNFHEYIIVDESNDEYSWSGFKIKVFEHCLSGKTRIGINSGVRLDDGGYEFTQEEFR